MVLRQWRGARRKTGRARARKFLVREVCLPVVFAVIAAITPTLVAAIGIVEVSHCIRCFVLDLRCPGSNSVDNADQ